MPADDFARIARAARESITGVGLKEMSLLTKTALRLILWTIVAAVCLYADGLVAFPWRLGTWTLLRVAGTLAAIRAGTAFLKCATQWVLARRRHPVVEAQMISRLYELLAAGGVIFAVVASFGKLGAFGALFAAFGGMLLGWSLQAPVSGFAAWVLVSLKRPFRPGDRIQLPSLGMTGDVKDIGMMYTVLDQVGGTIGSEEAVGRFILLPNAMLFSQVVINYTVQQDSPYMLDETVVRITFDSDWNESERILINAAKEVTSDIIAATRVEPYIRSDMYDYGVYLRLRYMTRVKNRAEIAYELTKRIYMEIQRNPSVDLAIPFIYSNRAALDKREEESPESRVPPGVVEIETDRIRGEATNMMPDALRQLSVSIAKSGLLQPIIVSENPVDKTYHILVGHARFEACKSLGWKRIPAVVQGRGPGWKPE